MSKTGPGGPSGRRCTGVQGIMFGQKKKMFTVRVREWQIMKSFVTGDVKNPTECGGPEQPEQGGWSW